MSSSNPLVIDLATGRIIQGPAIPSPFVFNTTSGKINIVASRAANNAAINNAKVGIFVAGSDTSGTAVGATGNYSTIGGGDRGEASKDYATVGGGLRNRAQGAQSCVPGGEQNTASGDWSFAAGFQSTAASVADVAIGDNCSANSAGNGGAVALGFTCVASAKGAVAVGISTQATAVGAFACGTSGVATAPSAFCEGASGFSIGAASHCEGQNCQATGAASHAEGSHCEADGVGGHAEGEYAFALREGQSAFASGSIDGNGGHSQTSRICLRGQTPGVGTNETVKLAYGIGGAQIFNLEATKTYEFRFVAVISALISAAVNTQRLEYILVCHVTGTTVTIDGAGAVLVSQIGSAGLAACGLTFTTATSELVVTFNTGVATTAFANVSCRVEFGEVILP